MKEGIIPPGEFTTTKITTAQAHRRGDALRSHMKSAHAGEFVETCRACMECKRKVDKE